MRYLNLVREVREAARLSKPGLANLLGKSANLIAAWELDPKPDEARQLARIAKEHGRSDVAAELLVLAGDDPSEEAAGLENLRSDERQLAQWAVEVYRDPRNEMEKAVVQLLLAVRSMRQQQKPLLPAGLADLSPENQGLLESFIKKPEAMMIVSAIVSGGNPPNAFATPSEETKSSGEYMAKRKTS